MKREVEKLYNLLSKNRSYIPSKFDQLTEKEKQKLITISRKLECFCGDVYRARSKK